MKDNEFCYKLAYLISKITGVESYNYMGFHYIVINNNILLIKESDLVDETWGKHAYDIHINNTQRLFTDICLKHNINYYSAIFH